MNSGREKKNKSSKNITKMVEDFNDIVEQTFYFEQKLYEWGNKVRDNKAKISKSLGNRKRAEVRVDKFLAFSVRKDTDINIDFNKAFLKKALGREKYNKIVDKEYKIRDMQGLIEVLKAHKVPPKEFRKFINIDEEVNVEKIDSLISTGDLKIEDLQGSYKVSFDEKININKTR